ncbi:MAG TPA: 2-dehydro-3-deoxy-6-phosphogalactonate aldolase [Sphingomonas sp.]|jgi:2-dehydro-3-deoxyphosphogalactonate aldolase|uniref:2-dehydro-3-deoxy-6-phosphogalactonate aldolase n=1 Tax=Sphingomonas sp. TaxID=28214 RepID=UPI002ED7CA5E
MSNLSTFDAAFARLPLVAILRGLRPEEAEGVGEALVEAGFSLIEVPLNSPEPFNSIARLAERLGGRAEVGAGTVLTTDAVARVEAAGGTMIISPNADGRVIAAAAERGLVSVPGIATASEAFTALDAGATALKLFPAEGSSPTVLKAMRAVLPADLRVLPVGGIAPDGMAPWLAAGAAGFGLGSALYKPGMSAGQVGATARAFVQAWKAMRPG